MRGYYNIKLPNPTHVYLPKAHMPRIKAKFRVRVTNHGHRVANYMHKWENTFLRRSGAALRAWILKSFKVVSDRKKHSNVGTPPYLHLKKKDFIYGAIQFFVDYRMRETLVGPAYSRCKLWGWKHEHGKKYGKATFPPRPFVAPQFHRWWKYGRPAIMKDIAVQIKGNS